MLSAQLQQLIRELRLPVDSAQAFSRCDRCNVAVEPIDKARVEGRVPPYVFRTQRAFHVCPSCRRIYWTATHWQRACRVFDRLRLPAPRTQALGAGQAGEEASHA